MLFEATLEPAEDFVRGRAGDILRSGQGPKIGKIEILLDFFVDFWRFMTKIVDFLPKIGHFGLKSGI